MVDNSCDCFDDNELDETSTEYVIVNGCRYSVGTKVKYWHTVSGRGQPITFERTDIIVQIGRYHFCTSWVGFQSKSNIIEVIDPVYYEPNVEQLPRRTSNRKYPSDCDVEIAWIWYVIIMVVGLIFKDRIVIWLFATIYFFAWKNGLFNGGNK